MKRYVLAVAVVVGLSAAPARAETLPLIEGMPTTYTPGVPFTFTLRIPELLGLTGYRLELVFATETPDPRLLASPSFDPPAGNTYVFGTPDQAAFTLDTSGPDVRLTITDSFDTPRDPPTDVTPGQNDFLATITVTPLAAANGLPAVSGPITISIGEGTRFVFSTESGPFDPPEPFTVFEAETPPVGNPVPAPPGLLLLAIGGLALGARARLARHKA